MITVNFGDLLAKLSSQETKQVLVQSNIAVIENSEPTLQENKGKKTYYDNVQKIRDFVSSESHEKAEIKKFQTQCKQVITSPFFNFNDIGKKGVKSVIQNRFWNLLAVLIEKHLNSIDDESLSTILYELFSFDEEWINQTENAFHQTLETLIQENDSFRKFHTICSDLLDLNEQDSESAKKYFLIYIMCLLCQKPIEKLWFMRAVTKLETKTIQHLLEILYFIAVPFSSEYENTGIKVSLKIVYEYISWTVNCSFEKIRNDIGIQRLLQLFSKNLKGKLNEVETLAVLDNLNSLIKSQSLKLDTIDLRKNLNLEDFAF